MTRRLPRKTLGIVLVILAASAYFAYFHSTFHQLPEQQLDAVETQINQHYREYRTFRYRWFGVPYAPLREPLTKNEDKEARKKLGRILRELDRVERALGPSLRSLKLRARIELLSERYDQAVQHYRLAILQTPSDDNLRLELGISFALRAHNDNRALDYEPALENMLQSQRHSETPEALFNIAALSQEFPLPYQSEEYWRKLVGVEKSPEWRQEVLASHTDAAQFLEQRKKHIQEITKSGSWFLAPPAVKGAYLELVAESALADWLPNAFRDAESRTALEHLASAIQDRYKDPWLKNLLTLPAKSRTSDMTQRAFKKLSETWNSNSRGEHRTAISQAIDAEKLFRKTGNSAGVLRSRLERAYAMQRTEQSSSCLEALGPLRTQARFLHYWWIAGQAWLVELTCKTQTNTPNLAEERRRAYDWIQTTGYEALQLRALNFLTDDYMSYGSRLNVWDKERRALSEFWSQFIPSLRGYSFYFDLAVSAHRLGDAHAASFFLRESTRVLADTPNRLLLGFLLADLGRWQTEAGLHSDAVDTFIEMHRQFGKPESSRMKDFQREAEIVHAEAEIIDGRARDAIKELQILEKCRPPVCSSMGKIERRRLLQALGNAFLARRQFGRAAKVFSKVILDARQKLKFVSNRAQRDNIQHTIEAAWRGMTQIHLCQNQKEQALAFWEAFRDGRIKDPSPQSIRTKEGIVFAAFAFLPDGLSAWVTDRYGTEQHWINKEAAIREAQQFSNFLADEHSPQAAVDSSARRLYDILFQPFADKLTRKGVMVVDAEGPLASIPWLALKDGNGQFLLERFAISQTVGWQEAHARLVSRKIDFKQTLIVAEPFLGKKIDLGQYPSLIQATREAEHLKKHVPNPVLLPGRDATLEALTASLPHSPVFYFAGHGVSYGGFGALVLAPRSDELPISLLTSRDILQLDLRKLQLAVLAACSSGTGEQYGVIDLDSLVRAFLEAGTSRIVAARWNVNADETANLMRPFLDLVLQGVHPAEALRQAAITMLHSNATLHPYYWAGFQVFGAP